MGMRVDGVTQRAAVGGKQRWRFDPAEVERRVSDMTLDMLGAEAEARLAREAVAGDGGLRWRQRSAPRQRYSWQRALLSRHLPHPRP